MKLLCLHRFSPSPLTMGLSDALPFSLLLFLLLPPHSSADSTHSGVLTHDEFSLQAEPGD